MSFQAPISYPGEHRPIRPPVKDHPGLDWRWDKKANFRNHQGRGDIDFARASGDWMIDGDGNLIWTPENLIIQSVAMTDAAWSVGSGGSITLAPTITDPFGKVGSVDLINLSSGADSRVFQEISSRVDNNQPVNFCLWLRSLSGTGTWPIAIGDSSNTFTDKTVELTEEWQRFDISVAPFPGTEIQWLYPGNKRDDTASTTLTKAYAFAPQGDRHGSPRPYNPTGAAAFYGPSFPRDASRTTIRDPRFRAQGQRTNLLLHSTQPQDNENAWGDSGATITKNATTFFGQNASRGVRTTTSAFQTIHGAQTITLSGATAGDVFTFSLYIQNNGGATDVKMIIIEDGGVAGSATDTSLITIDNNILKYTATYTIVENDRTSLRVTLYGQSADDYDMFSALWVLEEAPFAGDTIITYTAAATRAADDGTISGDLATWFNQGAGVFSARVHFPILTNLFVYYLQVDDGGASDRMLLAANSSELTQMSTRDSGGDDADSQTPGGTNFVAGTAFSAVGAYALNDVIGGQLGVLGVVDTSAGLPPTDTLTTARFGRSSAGAELYGSLGRITIIRSRKPNWQLQHLMAA